MSLSPRDPAYCPWPSYANEPHTLDRPVSPDASIRFLDRRSDCRHDVAPECDLHGCAYCQEQRENRPWIDPCLTCVQAREAAYQEFLALNPAVACERAGHLHCTTCGRCGICSGGVCRVCFTCAAHQEDTDENWPCEYTRWDRFMRRETTFYAHEMFDPATGRWQE